MDILFLSHTYWDSVFRVSSHHLAAQMVAAGHDVFYVSTPISPWHTFKSGGPPERFRRTGQLVAHSSNFTSLVPLTPVPAGRWLLGEHDIAFASSGFLSKRYKTRLTRTYDLIFIDDPKFAGLLTHLSWRKLIYRPTDIYSYMGLKHWKLLEGRILRQANCVIATAGPVAEFLRTQFSTHLPMLVQVNGVDLDLFRSPQASPPEYLDNSRKRCVYVGALDSRFDFAALDQLASHYGNIDFFIIGPLAQDTKTRAAVLPNLHWLGARPHHLVPAYLQHADIGLLPLTPIAANSGRSPMKIYEYLATGLPVVALHTDELARRQTPGILTYRTQGELLKTFADALAISSTDKICTIDAEFSWPIIARRILEFARQS